VLTVRLRGKRGTNGARHGYDMTYYGLRPNPDFGVCPDSGAPEFGFATLWLVKNLEMGDTTCGFYDPSMLSANMGARGCDGMCR
jgi:hypothetical protein